jgi:hypothetical protein
MKIDCIETLWHRDFPRFVWLQGSLCVPSFSLTQTCEGALQVPHRSR